MHPSVTDKNLAAAERSPRSYVNSCEGISTDALETRNKLHGDETDDDVGWETWEMTKGDDGNPEFRDVYTGVTLDPIAVGTARKEELLFAESLDAQSDAMQYMG